MGEATVVNKGCSALLPTPTAMASFANSQTLCALSAGMTVSHLPKHLKAVARIVHQAVNHCFDQILFKLCNTIGLRLQMNHSLTRPVMQAMQRCRVQDNSSIAMRAFGDPVHVRFRDASSWPNTRRTCARLLSEPPGRFKCCHMLPSASTAEINPRRTSCTSTCSRR